MDCLVRCFSGKKSVSMASPLDEFNRMQLKTNRYLFAIGIILMIAGIVATGCTYSKLGPNSLYIVGAAFVASLILIIKSTNCINRCCRKRTRVAVDFDDVHYALPIDSPVSQAKNSGFAFQISTVFNQVKEDRRERLNDYREALANMGVQIDTKGVATLPADWAMKYRMLSMEMPGGKAIEYGFEQMVLDQDKNFKFLIRYMQGADDELPEVTMLFMLLERITGTWLDETNPDRLGAFLKQE